MGRFCLVDVTGSAHSTTYLQSASESITKLGIEPVIVTSIDNPRRNELDGSISDVAMEYGSKLARIKNAIRLFSAVRSVHCEFAYHLTVGDHSLFGYGALSSKYVINEYAHWFHGPTLDSGTKVVSKQYAKSFVFNWAEEIGHFAPPKLGALPVPVHQFPDVTNVTLDCKSLDFSSQKSWSVGIIGNMSRYKGLLDFIQTAEKSSRSHTYLVAGNIPQWSYSDYELKTIVEFLSRPNVTYIEGYISDGQEINSLLSQCRLIWVAYNSFPHSSNILVKCSHFRVPVIANDFGLIGDAVSRYHLGVFLTSTFDDCVDTVSYDSIDSEFSVINSQSALDNLFKRIYC
jgi:hypothetical protein